MSKRAREASDVQVYRIADDLTLRVRFADDNVDGSLMLFRDGKTILECTHYKQAENKHFTEVD